MFVAITELVFSSPPSSTGNGKLEIENAQGKASKDEDDLAPPVQTWSGPCSNLTTTCAAARRACTNKDSANCKARGGWERERNSSSCFAVMHGRWLLPAGPTPQYFSLAIHAARTRRPAFWFHTGCSEPPRAFSL
jgi:hypothetical protein